MATLNAGANLLKSRVVRHMRASLKAAYKKHAPGTLPVLLLEHELTWLQLSDERAAKRTGGLGRK